ncbi:LOW QUALITY PROTEIN: zinc finger CCCH domain-containing protein 17-like [Rutidosis leptorrhynchoides]|uniref:LOW QUALITY PROTEIN: zinc finger CCCH domain-containing protein 17-like n=1 Tax=Rutidosis leptorrhynchoides TaxID=125765 RepID=UPI003A994AD9
MVSATQHQQQPQPSQPLTAEEEALKRNTDCVYFLASPLTCKKGAECEYRHSEYARVNPRDCYYWLNGNCMNPKCGFRHPPLDGLLGTQAATGSGSFVPPSQTAVAPVTHVSYNSGKPGVPCVFFQKGQCIKGDRCPFFHAPTNQFGNKSSQPTTVPAPVNEVPKKTFGGLQKCTAEERRVPPANISKAAPQEAKLQVKLAPKPLPVLKEEVPQYRPEMVSSIGNGNSGSRSNRSHQMDVSDDHGLQNGGYDNDEFLRESSPGFDVLVEDEKDSDYYQGEDQFGRPEGRNLNSVDEYNIDRSAEYNSMGDADRYHNPQGYDSYEHYDQMEGRYGWEQQKTSSERVGPSHLERRGGGGYMKSERPDHVKESDLRYRLSKPRGSTNGLRSVVSHDYPTDNRNEDNIYQPPYRRDLQRHEPSLSSRLRGRIKLPEREMDRGRNRSRYSPGRPPVSSSSHQGRLRDRIQGRVEENYYNEGRNFREPPRMMRRESSSDERRFGFDPPKSLAELKGKNVENREYNNSLRKRKSLEDHHLPSDGDFSFEGPKPLSEILKRKKGSEQPSSMNNDVQGKEDIQTSEHVVTDNKLSDSSGVEEEEVVVGGDGDDMREEEYEYEQGDEEGEYYEEEGYEEGTYEEGTYEDGENPAGEEEYVDEEGEEEEEDNVAKKIDVMLS